MNVEYIDHMGDDLSICRAARVSFNKDPKQFSFEQNARLIKYLAKHGHWSPFAHVVVSLRINAPIAIHAQCVKHQIGFAMNTVSRRYVSDEPDFFVPDFRQKADNVKQGSSEAIHPDNAAWQIIYKNKVGHLIAVYETMIADGIAPEQARFILPQGVYTEWVWTGSLQAWSRFYKQRTNPHAQKEIQELAYMASNIIEPLFPMAWQALIGEQHGRQHN